ncbi:MAG: MFS transporter [Bacteroidales bacterium]|nr:MFS transporter [Bacteroidales bacterium]MDD4823248.1 MFS transporter [Bacteroidales bacterium]
MEKKDGEVVKGKNRPWAWVPSLYVAEGLPYVAVMTIAGIMYKKLGVSNTDIALYMGWLYLPWVVKPLWSPFVDIMRTKRWWIVAMQLLVGICFAGIAFTLPGSLFLQSTLALFWLMAFSSATHDIAADGFYMLGLNPSKQAFFVGIRNTFYRIATLVGKGPLVMLAGALEVSTGDEHFAWSVVFAVLAVLFFGFSIYHQKMLPYPVEDKMGTSTPKEIMAGFVETFSSFFRKPGIGLALLFLLTYRLAESQLGMLAAPFMLDSMDVGGLGLTTSQVGTVNGTVGVVALVIGGLLGGFVVARHGLRAWIWPMVLAINLPDLVYIWMAYDQMTNLWLINLCVGIENLGYGFGFTAYTIYMMTYAEGEHKTAHFAICTAFMALGMMLPGMAAGWIQEEIGYRLFFVWVMVCTLPGFFLIPSIRKQIKNETNGVRN